MSIAFTLKSPIIISWFTLRTLSFNSPPFLFSFNFLFNNAIVKAVPQTGQLIYSAKYGIAPIWSSCPWVKKIPKNLSPKDLINSKSGNKTSIPKSVSSGKEIPKSISIHLSLKWYKFAFIPISSDPPTGRKIKSDLSKLIKIPKLPKHFYFLNISKPNLLR